MSATPRLITGVLVVEDHPLFRERLIELLNKEPDLRVVGETDNVRDALAFLLREQQSIELILLDITLKGRSGLDLLKEMKAQDIDIPVLILSMHDESLYAERSLRAGAKGYITKYSVSGEVMVAVRAVLSGQIYVSPKTASRLLAGLSSTRGLQGIAQLTDRELEIFRLIGCGATTREIAVQLNLGVTTVETYRSRIKTKLQLDTASRLSHRAVRWVQFGEELGTFEQQIVTRQSLGRRCVAYSTTKL